MNSKLAVLISLLVISVATLLMAIFGDNTIVYTVATVVSHLALVLFGYFYARRRIDTVIAEMRKDILGK